MGPIWGRQDPRGPHDGHMNLAIWIYLFVNFTIIPVSCDRITHAVQDCQWGNTEEYIKFQSIPKHRVVKRYSIHIIAKVYFIHKPQILTQLKKKLHPGELPQWASSQIRKIGGFACAGNARNVSPLPRVSNVDMHHGTCVKHVPWCMLHVPWCMLRSVSIAVGGGETFPAFPAHEQPGIVYVFGKRPIAKWIGSLSYAWWFKSHRLKPPWRCPMSGQLELLSHKCIITEHVDYVKKLFLSLQMILCFGRLKGK